MPFATWNVGTNPNDETGDTLREAFIKLRENFARPSLAVLGDVAPAADRVLYYTGANAAALAPLTEFGRSLIASGNAVAARNALSAAPAPVRIPAGADLNSYTSSGEFFIASAGDSTTIANVPVRRTGVTIGWTIRVGLVNTVGCTQQAHPRGTNELFVRGCNTVGLWTDWKELAWKDDVTTAVTALQTQIDAARQVQRLDFRLIHRRRLLKQFPRRFPDYPTVYAMGGNLSLSPQAFTIDEATDEIFILYAQYSAPNEAGWVAVFDWVSKTYKGCFSVGWSGEGLDIEYAGGTRLLTARRTNTSLAKFDITTLPANLSAPTPVSTHALTSVNHRFSRRGNEWLVAQTSSRAPSRHVMALYDSAFGRKGAFAFNFIEGGYTSDAVEDWFPKQQSLALGTNVVAAGLGGHWQAPEPITGYAHQGLRLHGLNGCKLIEAIWSPDRLITLANSNGWGFNKIENEGVHFTADGSLWSMHICKTIAGTSPTTDGIAIIEEFSTHPDAVDFSAAAASLPWYDPIATSVDLFPRVGPDLVNPFTGIAFASVADILGFMVAANHPTFSFYSNTGTAITDFLGGAIPGETLVTIHNCNASTFLMEWNVVSGNASQRVLRRFRIHRPSGIQLELTPIRLGGYTASADAAITGYITVYDSTGAARKVAVID